MVRERITPPAGMVAKRVPGGRYAVMTSNKGPLARVVRETWKKVWELEEGGKLGRAYQADFEIYDQRAQDPQNAQIDLYVGLK
jgi:predicted transcriptional regulator YdeE